MARDSLFLKIKVQLKGILIELEDLRNQSMRSMLIFKNIKEDDKSTCENSVRVLGKCISTYRVW